MTKPKTYTYQIQYDDNTYRMVDWTKTEFETVGKDMNADHTVSILSDGIFKLNDIRAIVILPEVEEEVTNEKKPEAQLTEWGFVDADTAAWLKAQGIDVVNGGSAE